MKTVQMEKDRFKKMMREHYPVYRSRDYWSCTAAFIGHLRHAGEACKLVRLCHTGWYADSEGSEIYVPHVWQLPVRNGSTKYIAGFMAGHSDCVMLSATNSRLDIFDTKEDAAHCADSFTEIRAEHAREWGDASNAELQAEQFAEDARGGMRGAFEECHAMVAELRACDAMARNPYGEQMPKSIRNRIRKALCAEHAKARRFIRDLSKALESLADAREQIAYLERMESQA